MPSPSTFLNRSLDFIPTYSIPLFPCNTLAFAAYRPFTPIHHELRSSSSSYRDCWHEVGQDL
ncbi:hypothetical protein FRX31_023990 [Thalictrum thalictroides]|uniref:Uncharacterized protein n=1 Tax=Thalictrum thalictroides TaxID=46969 RepID=A0A7J6VNG0_THATH|nr:hypothetical protein FRX31_023990 [Thalictrum thalictroides]